MPKKFLSIKEAMKDVSTPIMVFLSKGEVASQTTTLKAFSDGETTIVSNVDKLFDPVEGGNLPLVDKSEQPVEAAAFNQFDSLVTLKCSHCNALAGVDPDLAFAIVNEDMHGVCCGKEATYAYDESDDDESDEEELDNVDEDEDDDFDEVDDNESADDDDEDESEEASAVTDTAAPVVETPAAPAVVATPEAPAAVVADAPTTETAEAITTDPVVAAAPVAEAPAPATAETIEAVADATAAPAAADPTVASEQAPANPEVVAEQTVQEVNAASLVDGGNLKLVALASDHSEIAVFKGDTHVGTLKRSRASEVAAPLFDDGVKLASAFKPVFAANLDKQESGELAAYGYKPVVFKVNTSVLFDKRLEKEVATVKADADNTVKTRTDSMASLLELAFVGINKGVFEAPESTLASEIAKVLKRNGVKGAEREARRILAETAHNYVQAGVAKAKELAGQSTDYVRGVTDMVAKAEFTVSNEETPAGEVATVISTSLLPRTPAPAAEVASDETVGFQRPAQTGNRYTGLIKNLGRR